MSGPRKGRGTVEEDADELRRDDRSDAAGTHGATGRAARAEDAEGELRARLRSRPARMRRRCLTAHPTRIPDEVWDDRSTRAGAAGRRPRRASGKAGAVRHRPPQRARRRLAVRHRRARAAPGVPAATSSAPTPDPAPPRRRMAGIQLSGLASGLDTRVDHRQLMAVEKQPRDRIIANKQAAAPGAPEALQDIRDQAHRAQDRHRRRCRRSTTWGNSQTSTSTDATKATVRTVAGAPPGGYQLVVTPARPRRAGHLRLRRPPADGRLRSRSTAHARVDVAQGRRDASTTPSSAINEPSYPDGHRRLRRQRQRRARARRPHDGRREPGGRHRPGHAARQRRRRRRRHRSRSTASRSRRRPTSSPTRCPASS